MIRDRLLKEIAPLARKFGEDLVALIVPQFEHIRDRALDEARAKLRTDLEALTEPPPPPVAKRRKKRKPTRSVVAPAATTTKPTPSSGSRARARAVPRPSTAPQGIKQSVCSVCEQPGHNARSCPKRAAAIAKTSASTPQTTRPSDPLAPRLSTTERAALDKPCRDPSCRIARLHPAHGGAA